MDARLDYDAAAGVRDVIAGIGRTEDITLSPDNSRLVILDYFGKRIFVFAIRILRIFFRPSGLLGARTREKV